jgi:transcriptional regulator with XRE-family HTH domain
MSRNLNTHVDSKEGVSIRLRELRTTAGLSMKQMASLAGVTPGFISRLEKALRVPSLQMLELFAGVLNATGNVNTTAAFLARGERGVPTLTEATEAELRAELARRVHATPSVPIRLIGAADVSFPGRVYPTAPIEGGTS